MSTLQQHPTAHQILRNACTVRRASHSVAQKGSSLERDKAPRCAWHPSRVHTGLALLHDVRVQTRPWRRPVLAESRCGSRASRKVWLLLTQRLIEVQQMFENDTQGMCRHEPSRTGQGIECSRWRPPPHDQSGVVGNDRKSVHPCLAPLALGAAIKLVGVTELKWTDLTVHRCSGD